MYPKLNDYARSYIESTIREYKNIDSFTHQYLLSVNDIPKTEQQNIMDMLFENDVNFRELVRDYIDELLMDKVPEVESEDHRSHGLKPYTDPVNGENRWI